MRKFFLSVALALLLVGTAAVPSADAQVLRRNRAYYYGPDYAYPSYSYYYEPDGAYYYEPGYNYYPQPYYYYPGWRRWWW